MASPLLVAALVAAFGSAHPVRHARIPDAPPQLGQRDLSVEAAALTPLDHGRYALVVRESDNLAAHVERGAIGIAYLRRTAGGWRSEAVWPELMWTGNSGDPGQVTVRRDLGSDAVVVSTSDYVGQGEHDRSAAFVRLGARKPETLGRAPMGGSLEALACSVCNLYAFSGRISRPKHNGSFVLISYRGWQDGGPSSRRRRRFAVRTEFRSAAGKLLPVLDVRLPTGRLRDLMKAD